MEDQWKHIIESNREIFDAEEPDKGHFERFRNKLENQPVKVRLLRTWLAIAVVIIVLLATNQIRIYIQAIDSQSETLLANNNEYSEAEFYFASSTQEGIDKLKSFSEKGIISEQEQAIIKNEMLEFQKTFKTLQKELKMNPEDERIINAIIETYQTRLNIINMIIDTLEEVNNSVESKTKQNI